jgi:hypothetical protein
MKITKIPADPGVIEFLESDDYLFSANQAASQDWLNGILNSYTTWLVKLQKQSKTTSVGYGMWGRRIQVPPDEAVPIESDEMEQCE